MSIVKITIDIETIPSQRPGDYPVVEPKDPVRGKIPSNWKDSAKIAKKAVEIEEKYQADLEASQGLADKAAETQHRRQSFDHLLCEVITIGLAIEEHDPIVFSGREPEVMRNLGICIDALHPSATIQWQGHNITGFDLPILRLRAAKYDLDRLKMSIPLKRYAPMLVDSMELAKSTGTNNLGLDKLARFLGLGEKTEGLDGSKVYDYWKDERIEEIAEYCKNDVILTRAVIGVLS